MVVSCGQAMRASCASSNPAMASDCGTAICAALAAVSTPSAISSLLAKIALGGLGPRNSASAASSPERKVKSP